MEEHYALRSNIQAYQEAVANLTWIASRDGSALDPAMVLALNNLVWNGIDQLLPVLIEHFSAKLSESKQALRDAILNDK